MTPTISPTFERILVASQIEEGVINALVEWFPTYLTELEKQLDLIEGTLPVPSTYTNRNSFDAMPAEELPLVVVISPGVIGTPTSTGRGAYKARWRLGVGIATGANDEPTANMLVKAYAAAVRGILLQQQGTIGELLYGLTEITWEDESYDDLPIRAQSQLFKAASEFFIVDVNNVINKWAGPDTPDLPDYTRHTADRVIIDLQKEAI